MHGMEREMRGGPRGGGPEWGRARHHHPHGGPPWGGHMRGGWFGPPRPPGRRARRGDVRAALLAVLEERPLHGYDVISELEERSGGMWRPSPGSIYPTLQMLEDQGLLTSEQVDGKRVYSITDPGRAELAERRERAGGTPPWEMADGPSARSFAALRESVFGLGAAAMQVVHAGSPEQIERAAAIVADARKKLYSILTED